MQNTLVISMCITNAEVILLYSVEVVQLFPGHLLVILVNILGCKSSFNLNIYSQSPASISPYPYYSPLSHQISLTTPMKIPLKYSSFPPAWQLHLQHPLSSMVTIPLLQMPKSSRPNP